LPQVLPLLLPQVLPLLLPRQAPQSRQQRVRRSGLSAPPCWPLLLARQAIHRMRPIRRKRRQCR
jgi:hypothetical protein